jgi:hypothetical protein
MMMHIDLSSVLRQTLSCELYSNLVTRPTGAAVRAQIEALLADARERSLTVIDFSHVGMIDFSCADEVVAKLLLQSVSTERGEREEQGGEEIQPITGGDELLAAAWGYGYEGTARTVDNFISQLRQKLEPLPDDPRHYVTVRGQGYRFDP